MFTVSYLGWNGLKNGTLVRAAEDKGFDVLITGDQTLRYEQNVSQLRLAVVALTSVEWRLIREYLPEIRASVGKARPGSVATVDCGVFDRKKLRDS